MVDTEGEPSKQQKHQQQHEYQHNQKRQQQRGGGQLQVLDISDASINKNASNSKKARHSRSASNRTHAKAGSKHQQG
jgi:hypothetical protein